MPATDHPTTHHPAHHPATDEPTTDGPTNRRRARRTADPTASSRLAAACDAVFALDAPALVALVDSGCGWELRDGASFERPEDLIGVMAPPDCDGIAAVVTGTAHHLDAGSSQRARITFALLRTGESASTVTTTDGTTRLDHGTDPPTGHLADVCRRSLGLAAAPELSTPMDALTAGWLSDVLSAHDALGDGLPLDDWDGLLSLHPFGGRSSSATWAELHAELVRRGRGWGDLDAEDVAWADPPTFARFVLATFPPTSWLLAELGRRCEPEIVDRVLALIDGDGATP